jgi:hypothetical protein
VTPRPTASGTRLSYLKNANEVPGGELWTVRLPEEPPSDDAAEAGRCGGTPQSLGQAPNLGSLRLQEDMLRVVVAYDGATRAGELMLWKEQPPQQPDAADAPRLLAPVGWTLQGSDEELEALPNVAEISSLGVLANFDGTSGDLFRVDFSSEPISAQLLARGVPMNGHRGDALIRDFDGVTGELVVFDSETEELQPIANGVGREGYGFAVQFDAVIYLANRNPQDGTSTLEVTLLETGDVFEVDQGVVESREVGIPGPGILYSVAKPEDEAGIWFAGAR